MSQQFQKGNDGEPSVPAAPYPPMNSVKNDGGDNYLKSSLSPSPHYTHSAFRGGNEHVSVFGSNTERPPSSQTIGGGDTDELSMSARPFSELPKAARMAPYASQIKICPTWNDTVACINCTSPPLERGDGFNFKAPVMVSSPPPSRSRKAGPILLELRQVQLATRAQDEFDFFTTKTVGLSRGNPSLGTSVASTCLGLPVVKTFDSNAPSGPITGATGLTTGALCIHTFGDEKDSDGLLSSSIEYYHTPRHHRQASAVAWRPINTNHVAIGLLGSGSAPAPGGTANARRNPGVRAGGDREFCCYVWDIEAQSSKRTAQPMTKLSHNAAVASLAWLLDGQTLVVGGQSRNIQLYDMRVSGTNAPPISAHAHSMGVHGIQVDPHRPHFLATFSRTEGEPVKLWDVRRMDSVVSEIKVAPPTNSKTSPETSQSPVVSSIKWSTLESGTLSVAIGDSVQDYDTSSGSRPVLVRVNYAKEGQSIVDLALYEGQKQHRASIQSRSSRLIEVLYPRRMLAVLGDRTVCDMAKHTNSPVAISRRDGRLVHALGRTLWVGSTNEGPCAMESLKLHAEEDISATMMRRARCLHVARYSMNTASNIKMLSEEQPTGEAEESPSLRYGLLRLWSWYGLLRLWSWIDRVEALSNDTENLEDMDGVWPAKGLVDAGIWRLLRMDEGDSIDEMKISEALSCNTYDSQARRSALTSCGWAGKFDLINVLAECEALGEYERSAALAVWHGDIGAAVEALQRASGSVRLILGEEKTGSAFSHATPQYAETLDLIAMCIAGYGGNTESSTRVWRNACASLLRREDLSSDKTMSSRIAYLRGLCQFLMSIGVNGGLEQVLGNVHLSLCDRVAFACRFLPHKELRAYLTKSIESSQATGNIEGLVVTALSKDGIKILQAYMDRYSDVQTTALVVARVVLPSDWTVERKVCTEWVESYRGLLNTWQMWQSRAMFDVDRAELLRRFKAKHAADALPAGGSKAGNYPTRRIPHPTRRQGSRPMDPDIMPSIPAQLDARCNYCSSPLGLRRHEGNANQWLSKMKPVLSCCPQCRKPLPRCSICMLSLGVLNPYMELTRERSRPGPRGSAASPDDLSLLANLPFAEWFTWCMRCNHGGHAHHLVGWFSNHEACPVSGCECQCQFDGVQKLNRPALSPPPAAAKTNVLKNNLPSPGSLESVPSNFEGYSLK